MAMSKEALEAVEAIRRELRVEATIEHESANFYDHARIRLTVRLLLGGDVICESTDSASLPPAST